MDKARGYLRGDNDNVTLSSITSMKQMWAMLPSASVKHSPHSLVTHDLGTTGPHYERTQPENEEQLLLCDRLNLTL
jgi:hypothetical protein